MLLVPEAIICDRLGGKYAFFTMFAKSITFPERAGDPLQTLQNLAVGDREFLAREGASLIKRYFLNVFLLWGKLALPWGGAFV